MWEYDIRYYVHVSTMNLIEHQNHMGINNWEAYKILVENKIGGHFNNYTVFYKRKVERNG